MKHKFIFLLIFILPFSLFSQENVRQEFSIPDILGYQTLKCDFHMHTIYSDGEVLPLVRVQEAWAGGLDAIAITDHIEWWLFEEGEKADRNRPFEDAHKYAVKNGLTLIRAIEITKGMPPGHFNLLFLKDANKIDKSDYKKALIEAKNQSAFVFWNHPGWKPQAPNGIKWYDEHTEILNNGWMQGIEIVNWNEYYPEAIDWCIEKDLTMVGNSDMHMPEHTYLSQQNLKHRPITLVFSKSNKPDDIHEALNQKRTVLWFQDLLIGKTEYLLEIFNKSIQVKSIINTAENSYYIQIYNQSSIAFEMEITGEESQLITLPALKTKGFEIKMDKTPEVIPVKIKNLKTGSNSVLETKIKLKDER